MATELRKTGISVVGDVPWGTHFCTFYETKQDLLDILVPYFKTGLESKEFCLWIISNSELITTEEAKEALGEAVSDLDRYLAEGRIEILSHDEWFLRAGAFDSHKVAYGFKEKLDEALTNGYAGLRINGSPAWIQADDPNVLREFEGEADHFFADEHIIASCTYPLGESRSDFLLDVARNHQFAIARRHGNWEVLETPELIQAKQEITRLNEELERRVIERTKQLAATNEELRKEIAERRRAEEELRRSEDHLRLVIDAIPMMVWSVRPDGIVDFLNQRWLDYSGLSFEEYIKDQTASIHPEDLSRVLEKWRADMAAEEPYEAEMRLRGADGDYRWFLVRVAPLRDEQGNLVKWYGISIDIQERKQVEEALRQAEEKYHSIFEHAIEGIFQTTPDGHYIAANPALARMLGYDSPEELLKHRTDIARQQYVETERRAEFKRLLEEQGVVRRFEYQAYRKDGHKIWLSDNVRAVRDESGAVFYYEGSTEDITERKQVEE